MILKILIFKKGDTVDDEIIKESERKLRSLKFIGEAEIIKELIKDNKYNFKNSSKFTDSSYDIMRSNILFLIANS